MIEAISRVKLRTLSSPVPCTFFVGFKVERVHWKDEPETRSDQLVEQLKCTHQGWLAVVSVDLIAHGSFGVRPASGLLVREVTV